MSLRNDLSNLGLSLDSLSHCHSRNYVSTEYVEMKICGNCFTPRRRVLYLDKEWKKPHPERRCNKCLGISTAHAKAIKLAQTETAQQQRKKPQRKMAKNH